MAAAFHLSMQRSSSSVPLRFSESTLELLTLPLWGYAAVDLPWLILVQRTSFYAYWKDAKVKSSPGSQSLGWLSS